MFNHENYDHRLDRENIAERVPVKRAQKNQKETKQQKKKRWKSLGTVRQSLTRHQLNLCKPHQEFLKSFRAIKY